MPKYNPGERLNGDGRSAVLLTMVRYKPEIIYEERDEPLGAVAHGGETGALRPHYTRLGRG